MADDADAIYAEIEKRKLRAKELGVPQLVWDLFDTAKHYPRWISEQPSSLGKKLVPPFLLEIKQTEGDGVAFIYENVEYSFGWSRKYTDYAYSSRSRMSSSTARLTLNVAGVRVVEFTMNGTDYESEEWSPTEWNLGAVEAFVEGPWIERIAGLVTKIKQHQQDVHALEAKKRREDPAKLKDLKDRFGIK